MTESGGVRLYLPCAPAGRNDVCNKKRSKEFPSRSKAKSRLSFLLAGVQGLAKCQIETLPRWLLIDPTFQKQLRS